VRELRLHIDYSEPRRLPTKNDIVTLAAIVVRLSDIGALIGLHHDFSSPESNSSRDRAEACAEWARDAVCTLTTLAEKREKRVTFEAWT